MEIKRINCYCECAIKCNLLSASEIIKLLVQILEDQTSSVLIHRHICLLKHFFVNSGEEIMIGDLPNVAIVLDYICCLSNEVPEYKTHVYYLLYMLSKPPHLIKPSDSLNCDIVLAEFFNILGGLLFKTLSEPFIQKCILSIIHSLLVRKTPEPNSIVSPELCVKGINQSDLCRHLTNLTSLHMDYNLIEIHNVIEAILTQSKECCIQFLNWNLHNILLILMDNCAFDTDFSFAKHKCKKVIIPILSTLLECYETIKSKKHQDTIIKPASVKGIRNLVHLLNNAASQYQSIDVKFHRNEIASLLLQLVYLFPDTDFESSEIIDDLVSYSTYLSTKHINSKNLVSTLKLTNSREDYIFQKLMLCTTSLVVIYSPKSKVINQKTKRFVYTLLEYLDPRKITSQENCWNPVQKQDFMNTCLKILPLLIHVHLETYLEAKGPWVLVDILQLYMYDTMCIELLQWTVKSSIRLCNFVHEKEIREHNMIVTNNIRHNMDPAVFINLCKRLLYTDGMSLAYQQILTQLLCGVQLLLDESYEGYMNNESLLELCHMCLNRIKAQRENDSFLSNRLQVAVIDFVWTFIMYSESNCKSFIETNGIYHVLDALLSCRFPIKEIYLSLLVDICEEPKSVPYLMTWQSIKNNKKFGIIAMFCEFWRHQEKIHQVKRDKNGCISDIERPLMSSKQFQLLLLNDGNETSSPATLIELGNVRPKIYAIVHLIEERHEDIMHITREHYGIDYTDNLDCNDKVTYVLIKAYSKLKFGEIWQELDGDYTRQWPPQDITPLYRDIVHKLALRHLHWAGNVQLTQRNIVKEQLDAIAEEEQQFFITHNDSQIAPAMKALQELCFNSRIENRKFLLKAKNELHKSIVRCRQEANVFGATPIYPESINITTMTAAREPILPSATKNDHLSFITFSDTKTAVSFNSPQNFSPCSSTSSLNHLVKNLYTDAERDESLYQTKQLSQVENSQS